MPAFEIAYIPTVPELDLDDTGSTATKAALATLKIISEQNGFIRLFYGQQVESKETTQLCIEWEAVERHKDFMKSATYGPFLEGLKTYLSGPPSFFHVPLQPEFSKPGTAPVTEFVTWYFPPTYDTADWDTTFRTFVQVVNETAAGFHGVSYGWVEEELEHPGLADVGGKGKAFSAAFGWDSVDAHMAYRETDSFKEAIEALRSKGIKGVNMRHVPLKAFK